MQQEIKIRIWDKEEKCLFTEGMKYLKPFFDDNGKLFVGVFPDEHSQFIEFETSFYSGLKDKNKKEIYQGDIYKKGGNTYLVEYDILGGFHWRMIFDSWTKKNAFSSNQRSWLSKADSNLYEIIGNIYENPELVNEAT